MKRSLLAMLLALSGLILTGSFALASIELPRDLPLADRSSQLDRPSLAIDSLPPNAPDVPSCVYTGPMWVRWTLNAPMPTARHSFATIAPSGQSGFYAIGGLQGWADALTANERFNACSNTWQVRAPLPAPRGYVQAAELNSRIYVVGGVDHVVSGTFGVQSNVWVYNPSIDFWSEAANLPRALGGVAVAAVNGKLYAFGGFDSRGPGAGDVNAVYEYDPSHDRWSVRPSMPLGARSLAAAAELNGEIYVVGGTSGSLYGVTRNEVYDPIARTWRSAQPMEGFYGFSLFKAPDGFLYALGGSHDSNDNWNAMYRYDSAADAWTSIPDVLQINDSFSHGLAGGAYAAGRLFLLGGIGMRYGIPGFQEQNSNVNESMHLLESWCESNLQAQPAAAAPGDYITYTLELHGEVNSLPNVILLDPIPSGTTFAGFVGDPWGGSYNAAGNQVEWQAPLPANPQPITITFSVRVNVAGWTNGRFITNTMTIHNGLNVIERSAGTWIDAYDLSTSGKRVSRESAVVGDVMTYTVRVQTTASTSGTATMIDPIPLNTRYLTGSLTSTLGTASYNAGKIVWNGQLAPHTAVYANTSSDYQWGDSHGNGVVPGVKYDWIEIKDTGERYQFTEPDNAGCYHTAFPFDFTFYTSVYTKAAVSINGTLYFIDDWTGVTYDMSPDNSPLPGSNYYRGYSFGRFIAPFWDDLYMLPGKIYHQVFGVAPNRTVVIEFDNVTRRTGSANPGKPGSFEMIVFEGSSAIQFQYKDVDFGNPAFNNGASASIGMQSYADGLQYSYDTPSISDRLAILIVPPNHAITYTANFADITFAVTPDIVLPDRTPITNTATISSSAGQVVTREITSLYGAPDFSTSYKRVDQSVVQPGGTVHYEIHVINTGPVDGAVQLSDVIPSDLYFQLEYFNFLFGRGDYQNGVLTWKGVVPANSSATISYGAYVGYSTTHGQSIVNTATLTDVLSGRVYQPSVTLTVSKPADLAVTLSGPGAIAPLTPFTLTLTVTNHGPFDTDVSTALVDMLPSGAMFIDASPGGVYTPTTQAVTWPLDPLVTDETRALTLTAMLTDSLTSASVLTNTVNVIAIPQDTSAANNTQSWFMRMGTAPNLLNGTRKIATPIDIANGRVATYTVSIVNSGNLTASATITDPLPSGLIYQAGSSTLDGVPIELYNGTHNQIEWTGWIGVDQTLEVKFGVKAFATGGQVTNTVQIDDGTGLIVTRSAAIALPWPVYLPLIRR